MVGEGDLARRDRGWQVRGGAAKRSRYTMVHHVGNRRAGGEGGRARHVPRPFLPSLSLSLSLSLCLSVSPFMPLSIYLAAHTRNQRRRIRSGCCAINDQPPKTVLTLLSLV